MALADALDRASSSDFAEYDPSAVIDAVNGLVRLGGDDALGALDAYVAAAGLDDDPHRGLFLVLRVAFDADEHPPMRIGAPVPPPPPDAPPRFPILLVHDVPLLLVTGYTLGGLAEQVTAHLDYYRAHGTLRAEPLQPPAAVDYADVERAFEAAYGFPPDAAMQAHLAAQLDRANL